MKELCAGLLGLTLTSATALSASASDIYGGGYKGAPAYAVVIWSGFYGGINGGGGESTNSGDLSPSGGFGGGQIGYNWQGVFGLASPWVLGIEADIQGSGISDSAIFGNTSVESSLNWFGTVRGRIGYSIGPALIYFTGGLAFGEVEAKGSFWGGGNGFGVPFDVTETQTGYVLGGGVEYAFNPAWSLKGEYQFISLNASDFAGAGALGFTGGNRSEVNTFRIGVNYHAGPGLGLCIEHSC
ncbi:MAG: outer membrane beta-barrel protein [Rhodomicrobium sp.]